MKAEQRNPFEKAAPTKPVVPEQEHPEVPIGLLFDSLRQRVVSEAAKALVLKAKQEFEELVKRVGDNEAKSLIGKLVSERIMTQLNAAEANEKR